MVEEEKRLIEARVWVEACDWFEQLYNRLDRNDPSRRMPMELFRELKSTKGAYEDYINEVVKGGEGTMT